MKSRRRRSNADDGEIERESDEEQPRTNVSEATDNIVREEKDARKDFANKQLNVPRSGKFFLHDDRRRQGPSKKYLGATNSAHSIDDDSWKHDKFEEIVALESKNSNINNSRTKKHLNKKHEHVKSKIIDKHPSSKEVSAQVQIEKIVHHKQEATKKDSEISNSPAIIHTDMVERAGAPHSNGMEVKAKLNPDAKEFQPQIYNPYDSQPLRFISAIPQQIQPIPWLTTPSPYFGVPMQTQHISFENGSQRQMNPIKRKPVVSDKPIGVNAKVD